MSELKLIYRGVEVPANMWRIVADNEDEFEGWTAGVDAALDGPEEAPKLTRAFASVREWAEAQGVAHGDLDYMARAWSPGEPKAPRVFHTNADIPADVRKIELACGDIAHRVDAERWLFYPTSDPSDSWRIPPEDFPVTEVIE